MRSPSRVSACCLSSNWSCIATSLTSLHAIHVYQSPPLVAGSDVVLSCLTHHVSSRLLTPVYLIRSCCSQFLKYILHTVLVGATATNILVPAGSSFFVIIVLYPLSNVAPMGYVLLAKSGNLSVLSVKSFNLNCQPTVVFVYLTCILLHLSFRSHLVLIREYSTIFSSSSHHDPMLSVHTQNVHSSHASSTISNHSIHSVSTCLPSTIIVCVIFASWFKSRSVLAPRSTFFRVVPHR